MAPKNEHDRRKCGNRQLSYCMIQYQYSTLTQKQNVAYKKKNMLLDYKMLQCGFETHKAMYTSRGKEETVMSEKLGLK